MPNMGISLLQRRAVWQIKTSPFNMNMEKDFKIMNLLHKLGLAALATALLPQAISAQQSSTMSGSDCRQFLQAVEIANEQNARTENQKKASQAAQDEIIVTIFWVHGYLTGKSGQTPVIDNAWIAQTVGKLATACRAEGAASKSISEVVKQL